MDDKLLELMQEKNEVIEKLKAENELLRKMVKQLRESKNLMIDTFILKKTNN